VIYYVFFCFCDSNTHAFPSLVLIWSFAIHHGTVQKHGGEGAALLQTLPGSRRQGGRVQLHCFKDPKDKGEKAIYLGVSDYLPHIIQGQDFFTLASLGRMPLLSTRRWTSAASRSQRPRSRSSPRYTPLGSTITLMQIPSRSWPGIDTSKLDRWTTSEYVPCEMVNRLGFHLQNWRNCR